MKKYLTILAAMMASATFCVNAQNINASVQVTNSYRSSVGDFSKRALEVNVPDSALRFDYEFDYSVFDSPYRGAYEFTPYAVKVIPEPQGYQGRNLYVKAGAGYPVYPVLQAVVATKPRENFAMSVYQDLQGYYGQYWAVSPSDMKVVKEMYEGYDISEKFGIEGSWRNEALQASWDVDYRGLYNSDSRLPSTYHSGGVKANFRSVNGGPSYFLYDVTLSGRVGADVLDHYFEPVNVMQQSYALDATFGPVIKGAYRILVDVNARHDTYSGISAGRTTGLQAYPRAEFLFGRFNISAGARLSYIRSFRIHPEIDLSLSLLNGAVEIYAGLTGGQHLNSYMEFKETYHRFNISYTDDVSSVTNDKFDVFAGVRGHIGGFFQYDLKGGYALLDNVPMAAVARVPAFLTTIAYKDFNLIYADASLSWKSERVDASAGVHFRKTSLGMPEDCFDLPMFSGDVSFTYNFRKRIYAGVTCEGSTSRGDIAAYADLGVYGEYRFTDRFSVWAKGGNLLDMAIQRIPRYVESGINFTAGITLNL